MLAQRLGLLYTGCGGKGSTKLTLELGVPYTGLFIDPALGFLYTGVEVT